MTLIITLAKHDEVHVCSDYCLSDRGVPRETANGTKQLSVHAQHWSAMIAFTGIAYDGQGYKTREWLSEEGSTLDVASGPDAFVESLARRGTMELRRVTES